jgi:hypothetical protein
MSSQTKYYVIYSEQDRPMALELTQKLEKIEVLTSPIKQIINPGDLIDDFRDAVFIVLLSSKSNNDKIFQFQINYAIANNLVLIPVYIEPCIVPQGLQKIVPFDYQYLLTRQKEKFFEIAGIPEYVNRSKNVFIDDYPAQSYPIQSEESAPPKSIFKTNAPPKSIFKSIIETINPFKKSKQKSIFDDLDNMVGSRGPATGSPARGSSAKPDSQPKSSGAEAHENAAAIESSQQPEKEPPTLNPDLFENLPKPSGIYIPHDRYFEEAAPLPQQEAAPLEAPGKGKVLYDIPENMTVNVQQKCIVRVGKNEAIVLDDDTFSPGVKIETIPISKVMEVDMVDVSDPPRFNIKKISSVEQLVEDDSYSEWIFMVTPLTGGVYPLLLKVSVIKIIDGKERRKELVYTQSVNIVTVPSTNPSSIMSLVSEPLAQTNETQLKELMKEKDVKELDPPSVFISYAHNDKTYFDIFIEYLKTHSGWKIWTDRNIEIGSDWFQSIQTSISDSDIAVLLISANFISSGFIKEHEFHQFSSLQSAKPKFKFLPVLLRDVDFTRWEDLAAMQLFVAYGDEYGVPEKKGVMIPFAKLCRFDNNSQLIPNDNIDTYFKNMVKKAEKDWLISHV